MLWYDGIEARDTRNSTHVRSSSSQPHAVGSLDCSGGGGSRLCGHWDARDASGICPMQISPCRRCPGRARMNGKLANWPTKRTSILPANIVTGTGS